MNKKQLIAINIVLILSLIMVGGCANKNYDSFAKCISDKNATFYGAYWCPHCNDQKELFGDSFQYVNYVECGIPGDPRGQTEICKKENIQYYPTWEINGEKTSRVYTIEELGLLTKCAV